MIEYYDNPRTISNIHVFYENESPHPYLKKFYVGAFCFIKLVLQQNMTKRGKADPLAAELIEKLHKYSKEYRSHRIRGVDDFHDLPMVEPTHAYNRKNFFYILTSIVIHERLKDVWFERASSFFKSLLDDINVYEAEYDNNDHARINDLLIQYMHSSCQFTSNRLDELSEIWE